jgi:hypothetical protein
MAFDPQCICSENKTSTDMTQVVNVPSAQMPFPSLAASQQRTNACKTSSNIPKFEFVHPISLFISSCINQQLAKSPHARPCESLSFHSLPDHHSQNTQSPPPQHNAHEQVASTRRSRIILELHAPTNFSISMLQFHHAFVDASSEFRDRGG